jgi:hypothetical protein
MKIHSIANCFPLLTGEAFDGLVTDIKQRGLLPPIITYKGKILDGRNRQLACEAAHVKPRYEEWKPRNKDDTPLDFVISSNLARRHLNESQRAMVAAKLSNLPAHRPGKGSAPIGGLSQPKAAKAMGVSPRSVQRAKVVLKQGEPELAAAVEAGHIKVNAAAAIASDAR